MFSDDYYPRLLSDTTIRKYRPTRLIIKELEGQFYFCKSIVNDVEKYTGSGVIWRKRIKKYGRDKIKTLWISDWYTCPNEIQEVALHFSRENEIVESSKWANLRPENGINGGGQLGIKPNYSSEGKINQRINGKKQSNNFINVSFEVRSKRSIKISRERVMNGTHHLLKRDDGTSVASDRAKNGTANYLIRGEGSPRYDDTVHIFENTKTMKREVCTQWQLRNQYNLHGGNLSQVIGGTRKTTGGWKIIK